MTSKWVRMVAAQRDGYDKGRTSGLQLLRAAAQARAEHGRAAVRAVPSARVADDRSVTDEGRDDHIVMTCT